MRKPRWQQARFESTLTPSMIASYDSVPTEYNVSTKTNKVVAQVHARTEYALLQRWFRVAMAMNISGCVDIVRDKKL